MKSQSMRCISVLLMLAVAACGTAPTPGSSKPEAIPLGAKVAFAVGRFDPKLALDAGSEAGRGAARGVDACANLGALGAIALVCMPFGALAGAIAGSSKAATGESVATAEKRMAAASKALDLPPILAARLERYARESGVGGVVELRDEGPRSVEDQPRYRAGPDYVVEVSITDVKAATPGSAKLPYRFIISARGRLVRVADNLVVDEFVKRTGTNLRTVDQWTAENGEVISAELGGTVEHIAQSFIDEWLVIYRGEPVEQAAIAPETTQQGFPGSGSQHQPAASLPSDATETQHTPDYVLRPIDPPVRTSIRFRQPVFAGNQTPANVKTLTPTLSWENLPRTVRTEYFVGASPRARNLVYDVKIYNAGLAGIIVPANLVRRYSNLSKATVDVEPPLSPCTYYFWTVRARFELEGRGRATEWSFGSTNLDPRRERRSSTSGSAYFFYYPFRTPAAEGQRCGAPLFIKLTMRDQSGSAPVS